jgi:hypothetical protein
MKKAFCISLNPVRATAVIQKKLFATTTLFVPEGVFLPARVYFGVKASFPKVMIKGENDYKTNGRLFGEGVVVSIKEYEIADLIGTKDDKKSKIKEKAWIDDAYLEKILASKGKIYIWTFCDIKIYGRPRKPDALFYYSDSRVGCIKKNCVFWDSATKKCLYEDFSKKKKVTCIYDKKAKMKELPNVCCVVREKE